MKRKKKKYPRERYSYNTINPWFFWYECQACGHEFKKEKLHMIILRWSKKAIDGSWGVVMKAPSREYSDFYYCTSCCGTEEEARDHFQKHILPYYS